MTSSASARATHRVVLATARLAVQDLARVVDTATDGVLRAMARRDAAPPAARRAVLLAIHAGADGARAAIASSVLGSRQQAREAAQVRFSADLSTATSALEEDGQPVWRWYGGGLLGPLVGSDRAEDLNASAAAAESLTAAWRASLGGAAVSAIRGERSVDDALRAAFRPARLESVATTEVPRAFNDELRQQVDALRGPPAELLGRRWDATLETPVGVADTGKRTAGSCDVCARYHGVVVPPGSSWGGHEPGYVHPHCQCVATLVRRGATGARALPAEAEGAVGT